MCSLGFAINHHKDAQLAARASDFSMILSWRVWRKEKVTRRRSVGGAEESLGAFLVGVFQKFSGREKYNKKQT
jgi:hypothetical protein